MGEGVQLVSDTVSAPEPDDWFNGPPCVPAVLVEGHDWSFAATTREGRKTVCADTVTARFLGGRPLESTRDALSIY